MLSCSGINIPWNQFSNLTFRLLIEKVRVSLQLDGRAAQSGVENLATA